ncbi:hypothetical protein HDU77_001658, partial [Chytriomyces hyalinus]
LRDERIRKQAIASMRLKDVLGSAELRRIRTRDTLPRGGRCPRLGLEWEFADASGTLRNVDAVKSVEMDTGE